MSQCDRVKASRIDCCLHDFCLCRRLLRVYLLILCVFSGFVLVIFQSMICHKYWPLHHTSLILRKTCLFVLYSLLFTISYPSAPAQEKSTSRASSTMISVSSSAPRYPLMPQGLFFFGRSIDMADHKDIVKKDFPSIRQASNCLLCHIPRHDPGLFFQVRCL